MNLFRSKRRLFKGLGLLEIGLGLGIFGLVAAGAAREITSRAGNAKAESAAIQLEQAASASKEYIRLYRAQLLAATTPGGPPIGLFVGRTGASIPGGGAPEAPDLPSVQGAGLLPLSYMDRTPYQQRHVLLVRQTSLGVLEALVTGGWGDAVPDRAMARIMSRLGPPGGGVMQRPSGGDLGKILGTGGAWEISQTERWGGWRTDNNWYVRTSAPVYHLGVHSTPQLQDYLYRNTFGNPANPEANTMQTALNMGSQDINSARRLTAQDAILQNGGMACAANTTGCVFRISNDGGFQDNNSGWMLFVGRFGGVLDPGVDRANYVSRTFSAPAFNPERGLYVGGQRGNNLYVEGNSSVRGRLSVAGVAEFYNDTEIGRDMTVDGKGSFLGRLGSFSIPPNNVPSGWPGGVATHDAVASGAVAAGYGHPSVGPGNVAAYLSWNGDVGGLRDGLIGRNLRVSGRLATNGYDPNNFPSGFGGGVRTADVTASAGIYTWDAGFAAPTAGKNWEGWNWGNLVASSVEEQGTACPADGAIARSASNGGPLWCQGNAWVQFGGGVLGKIISMSGWNTICEPGYYPRTFHFNVGNSNNSIVPQCVRWGY
jgi:hypothetical protein